MKSTGIAMICRMLIVSMMFLSFHASADMIGTEQVASAAASAAAERSQIQSMLSRADVASQLKSLGVDVKAAQDRVAVMTDEEARSLAGKLPTMPAGADSDGWVIAAIVVAAVLLWWWWARR